MVTWFMVLRNLNSDGLKAYSENFLTQFEQIFHHWSRVATDSISWDYPVRTRD